MERKRKKLYFIWLNLCRIRNLIVFLDRIRNRVFFSEVGFVFFEGGVRIRVKSTRIRNPASTNKVYLRFTQIIANNTEEGARRIQYLHLAQVLIMHAVLGLN